MKQQFLPSRRAFLQHLGAGAVLCLALAAGCGAPTTTATSGDGHDHEGHAAPQFTYSGSGPIKAVATTGMVADLVRNVGGTHVEAVAMMGAGVDPHLYKPTSGDIRKLNEADMVFFNGLHLEGKMADILEKLETKKPSIAVGARVEKSKRLRFAASPQYPDPHIWFDVRLWMTALESVRDSLSAYDPPHKADYESNASAYLAELKKLDAETRAAIATIPADRRVLVTAHDAFNYFGRAYLIEVQGLQGISTATEASLKDVVRVVDVLVKRKIKAVFVESSVPRRTIEAVVQGAQARGHKVVIGGQLYSDAMGEAGTPEGTYLGMVRANVRTIVKALK